MLNQGLTESGLDGTQSQELQPEQSRLDLGPRDGYKWGGGFSPHFPASVLKTQGEKDVRRQVQLSPRKTANRQDLPAPGTERGEVWSGVWG